MSEPHSTFFHVCHVPGRRLARLCFGGGTEALAGADAVVHGSHLPLRPGDLFAAFWWERSGEADDEQWGSLAVMQLLPSGAQGGRTMPHVSGRVDVLGAVGQGGPPGIDGVVDRAILLLHQIVDLGLDPAQLTAAYWRTAVIDLQMGRRPAPPEVARRRRPAPRGHRMAA